MKQLLCARPECGIVFTLKGYWHQKYCSEKCRHRHSETKYRELVGCSKSWFFRKKKKRNETMVPSNRANREEETEISLEDLRYMEGDSKWDRMVDFIELLEMLKTFDQKFTLTKYFKGNSSGWSQGYSATLPSGVRIVCNVSAGMA